jgi:uncharacterized membrane protein YwaF
VDLFSGEHLAVLLVTALACLGSGLAARRAPEATRVDLAGRGLAVVLVVNEIVFYVLLARDQGLSARTDLPLELTNAATIAAVIALWRPSPLAFELTYFWAFSAHAGVMVAAVFLAWGRRRTPRPGAVARVFAWSVGVAVLAAIGTLATGGNYMFLRRPPRQDSLLDLMGPWPWYIPAAAALALALFWLLDRPFDGRRAHGSAG